MLFTYAVSEVDVGPAVQQEFERLLCRQGAVGDCVVDCTVLVLEGTHTRIDMIVHPSFYNNLNDDTVFVV